VAVGVFIGTFPVGGRTLADRIVSAYEVAPSAVAAVQSQAGRTPARKATVARAEAKKPTGPISAGQANSPERRSDDERLALEKLIAARAGR
jgi:hypothetical protein